MKKQILSLATIALLGSLTFSSCKKEGCTDPKATNYDEEAKEDDGSCEFPAIVADLSGEVEGVLEKGTYTVKSDLIIPAGKEWKLMPGVVLAFDGDGLSPETSPELRVLGDLIAVGTAADPILFTVVESKRKPENAYEGFWGGIQAYPTSKAFVLQHCIVEYTGGPSSQNDIYDAGDPRFALHFANPEGVLVFDRCTLRHTADDGIRPQGGGKLAIINSVFYDVGETGGEGLNIKDGSRGDVAFNLFYSVATNGSKPAGPGDGVPQTEINTYNNTFVNCGFRRVQSGRGGSINFEDGAKGVAYNNLIVNCRFGIRLRADRLPDVANLSYDYTHYYANDPVDEDNFFPSTDVDDNGDRLTSQQPNDIIQVDPQFVNYDVATSKTEKYIDGKDFYLKAGSPGVGKGFTGFSPVNATLSAGGVTVTIPAPANYIGAFGTK